MQAKQKQEDNREQKTETYNPNQVPNEAPNQIVQIVNSNKLKP